MAAYGALVSLSQTIQHILQQDDDDQSSLFLREKQRLRSLHDHVVFLQSILEEKLAQDLEGRIRDKANETEDIIEYLILNQIQSFSPRCKIAGLGNVKCFSFISEPIRSCYSHPRGAGTGDVQSPHHQYDIKKLYKKLQKVRHEMDSIVRQVMAIKNSLRSGDVELMSDFPTASSLSRQEPARTNKDSMVGFDEDLNLIKARLCGESPKLQVIPILGMGGIGKTTLAINAYQDQLTMEHFDIRAWVTVSQDYSVKRILSELLVSVRTLDEEEKSDQSNEIMDVRVYKSLKGRRYLVVMDDMWSTNVWDDLKRLLPDDNNGSRIILTTRLSDVAGYAGDSTCLHKMQLMDVGQSWHLLSQNVFKQEQCPHELEDIGRMIARSCRGLPLAIVVIAGVLTMVSRTRASWMKVAENVNLAVSNEEQFANILSLSYTHLPHHLRSCFLYMGGFPEDYEISVSKIIKLWTAEGFLTSSGSKNYEESAEEYLEDLVKRSLILVTKRKSNGKIKTCNVHDMVRDLCIRKAEEEKFLLNLLVRDVNVTHDQHRVSTYHILDLRFYDSSIRTILWFSFSVHLEATYWLKDFRLLRVLNAPHVKLECNEFPTEILELIFLRYLSLRFAFVSELKIPASISRLRNLETLIINPNVSRYMRTRYRLQFPLEIWGMKKLRHLVLFTVDTLPDPCPGYSALENLQTLAHVSNFKCTEEISQMIPNLKRLRIIYAGDEVERSRHEYHLDNLVHLQRLEKLSICIDDWKCFRFGGNLAFPKMLKKLKLKSFLLDFQCMEMIGSLPNLQVLKLCNCDFEDYKWETNEGQFPQLKFLKITETNLQQWIITESSHFPRLERIMLCLCNNLVEIPADIEEIPTLELIEVYQQDMPLVESAKRMQEEQQSYGNDTLQVRILKNYEFN